MAPPTRPTSARQLVGGLAGLGLLLVLATLVVFGLWRGVSEVDPQVAAAGAIAASTVVVVPLTRWYDRRRLREEPLQGRKIEVYDRFIRGFLDNFFDNKRGGVEEEKVAAFMFGVTPDLTIWASDDVLRRWSLLRRRWANRDPTLEVDASGLYELEALLLSIRSDLGHRNKGLYAGDVLGLWVNDIGDWSPSRDNGADDADSRRRHAA